MMLLRKWIKVLFFVCWGVAWWYRDLIGAGFFWCAVVLTGLVVMLNWQDAYSLYRGGSSKIYWLDLDGIELACFPDRQDSSRVNRAVCSEALRYAGQALDVSYYQSVPGGRYRVFEIVAPDGVLLDYATAHQEYVADEAAMWQRFYNGLLLMTLPFSLLGVLAYWAVGEDY